MGVSLYTAVVLTATAEAAFHTPSWTALHGAAIAACPVLFFGILLLFDVMPFSFVTDEQHLFVPTVAREPAYWLAVVLSVVVALLPEFTIRAFVRHLAPSDEQIVAEEAAEEAEAAARRRRGGTAEGCERVIERFLVGELAQRHNRAAAALLALVAALGGVALVFIACAAIGII